MERSLSLALNDRVDPDTDLGRMLADAMGRVAPHSTSNARLGTSGCLLNDVGQYLIFLLQSASELSDGLVTHQSVHLYNSHRLQENDESENGPADTHISYYLSETLDVLKLVSLPIPSVVISDFLTRPKIETSPQVLLILAPRWKHSGRTDQSIRFLIRFPLWLAPPASTNHRTRHRDWELLGLCQQAPNQQLWVLVRSRIAFRIPEPVVDK